MRIVLNRPKLFIFEIEGNEEIEVNAMDFKDACLTLEEQAPDLKKYKPITGKKIKAFFKTIDGIENRSVQKIVSQADWCFIA